MGGGGQQDGCPSVPPPPSGWSAGQNRGSILPRMWGPAKMTRQGPARDPSLITWRPATCLVTRGEGRGETRHFFKYSLIKGYFKRPISQNLSVKLAATLLQCQSLPISFLRSVKRENVAFIVTQANLRPAKTAPLSQLATLHSTGNISAESSEHQEQSRPQQHTWNSKLFVIFPLKCTAAHSLHIQHLLCGLRL